MPHPAQFLHIIWQTITSVRASGGFQPQQQTFVDHIHRTTDHLKQALDPIPDSDIALRRIIPTFGDSLLQKEIALFGYARLLLDSPASFDGASLTATQASAMQTIFDVGQALYQQTEKIRQEAATERRQQHRAAPQAINLSQFLEMQHPILAYWLRDEPLQLSLMMAPTPDVMAASYHLAAFIEHIIRTLSQELLEYGHIKVSTVYDGSYGAIHIFATGITLDASEQEVLFKKEGRSLYLQRFLADGGAFAFSHDRGRGATIILRLPLADTVTS